MPLVEPLNLVLSWSSSLSYGVSVDYYTVRYSFAPPNAALGQTFASTRLVPAVAGDTQTMIIEAHNGWTYQFSVSATSIAGTSSTTNATYTVAVAPLIPAFKPTFNPMTIDNGMASFFVDWLVDEGDVGVDTQELQVSEDNLSFTTVATVSLTSSSDSMTTTARVPFTTEYSSATFVSVAAGKRFYFRVMTSNFAGKGVAGEVGIINTLLPPTMPAGMNFSITVPDKAQYVDAFWNDAADGYTAQGEIEYLVLMTTDSPFGEQNWLTIANTTTDITVNLLLSLGQT